MKLIIAILVSMMAVTAFSLSVSFIAPYFMPDFSNSLKDFSDTTKHFNNTQGNYYMTHYQFGYSEQKISSIATNNLGEMFFANIQGITIYNGDVYRNLKQPEKPICMNFFIEKDIMLVGCKNDYGYLKRDNFGEYKFFSLKSNNIKTGDFSNIKITDSFIYYYSDESIICHDKNTMKLLKAWYPRKGEKHNGIIQFGNHVYINKGNSGLLEIGNEKENTIVPNSLILSTTKILFSINLSEKRLLIGTENNNLFEFDGNKIKEYFLNDQHYLNEHSLNGGIDLPGHFFVLSTKSGGIILVDKTNPTIKSMVNYQNGLPDDEIFAIGKDWQGGLWVSHGFGISRINYQLPVEDYSKYPGIEGNIADIEKLRNTLYVATSQGVYYLDSIKGIKEFETFIKKQHFDGIINQKIVPFEEINGKTNAHEEDGNSEKKKNFVQRQIEKWGKRRKEKKQSTETINGTKKGTNVPSKDSLNNKVNNEIKVNRKNETTGKVKAKFFEYSYVYKKIKNVNGKCKQIVKADDQLLVATNNGLYSIKSTESKLIIKSHYINTIQPSSAKGLFYIGTDKGLMAIKKQNDGWTEIKTVGKDFTEEVYSISEDEYKNLWLASSNSVYYWTKDNSSYKKSIESFQSRNEVHKNIKIKQLNKQTYFFINRQIYRFDKIKKKIIPDNKLIQNIPSILDIISNNDIIWFKFKENWKYLSSTIKLNDSQVSFINLFDNIQNIKIGDNHSLWIIDNERNLYKIQDVIKHDSTSRKFHVFLEKIQEEKGNLIQLENITIGSEIKSLTLKTSAPYYLRAEEMKYQYLLEGRMNNWSEWKSTSSFDFLIYPGKFKIKIRAKNIFGDIVESNEYHVEANAPIWRKPWFVLSLIMFSFGLISVLAYLVMKKRERKLLRDKRNLELRVIERTAEIRKQKEQLELKNKEITNSLNYASQIQSAILPPIETLSRHVEDYFLINKPKDIVSGDFYWFSKIGEKLIITAADCTGHGVPGAFLSLLGVTFLNEITLKIEPLKTHLVLECLRERIINSLNQEGLNKKRYDGIDLSMVIIDLNSMELQFAGANNPIYIIRKGHLTEIRGNRMPVGMQSLKPEPFTNHVIEIKKGDMIYMFSDGYIDQFGGGTGRKFLSRHFKVLLTEIYGHSMEEQEKILLETFNLWKGEFEQIDDVLVLGIKI